MNELIASLNARLGSLGRESAVLALGSGVAMVASLAVLVTLVQVLPKAQVGMLILISTYPLLIHQFFNLQSWQGYGRHALALYEDGRISQFQGLTRAFFRLDAFCALVSTIMGVLLVGVALWLFAWPGSWQWPLILFCCTLLTNFSSFSFAVFRCFKAYQAQTLCTLALPLAQLACALLFAAQGRSVDAFLLAWMVLMVCSNALSLALAMLILRRRGMAGWLESRERSTVGALRFTVWVNVATSLDSVVKQLDVLLVSALVSVESVPVYRLIKQTGAVLYRFGDAVAQASFPRLVALVVRGQQPQALALFKSSAVWSTGVATLAMLIISGSSSLWLPRLFTADFLSASTVLAVYLLIVTVAVSFTNLHQLVYALGYVRLPALFTLIAVTVFLFLTWRLAPSVGLWGFLAGFVGYHAIAIGSRLLLLRSHFSAPAPPATAH